MEKRIAIIMAAVAATLLCLGSCKNNSGSEGKEENKNPEGKEKAEGKIAEASEEKVIDVVYLANLYCKTEDMDKARIFLGKATNPLFEVQKDVENNYASVYARTQYQNSLEFYMWTDKDGTKILGVNLTEEGEKGHNRKSLAFYTYEARLDMVVPCKRLNEIITNKLLSMRREISAFVLRIPKSPEDENITFGYWEKKDKDKYNELVFKWDGHTFNI
ncbi:MAG: hypothetical protein J6T04_01450 [Bacteroidales bacterium]|nr:hypothetical protein [Bacteroidales bacterium]